MGPLAWFQLPDAGVGLPPSVGDRARGDAHGGSGVGVQPVPLGGGGQQQERFAEDVELELATDPISSTYRAARVAGEEVQQPLCRYRSAAVRG